MDNEILFSIHTCTYNRKDTLVRTYESLVSQEFTGFEWIVYDNGSTDGTSELVKQWQSDAAFPIVLLGRPDNAAVQLSWNVGINAARGKFWTLLDSDDACIPTALARFKSMWETIEEEARAEFVGVTCNCIDQHGDIVGRPFPESPMDSNSLDMSYKHNIPGEKWGVMRVDVLRKFPFPDTDYHVLPGIVWRRIAKQYKTRFFNESLRIYYVDEGTRKDQLSFHQKIEVIAVGKRENSLDLLNNYYEWLKESPKEIARNAFVYSQMASALHHGFLSQLKAVNHTGAKVQVALLWPLAKVWHYVPGNFVRKVQAWFDR